MTKKRKQKTYRGIYYELNGPYSWRKYKCVVFCPDIERYFKSTSGVRKFIDKHHEAMMKIQNEPWPDIKNEEITEYLTQMNDLESITF